MSMKKYAIFIGRFQPYHNGHRHVVESALRDFDELIIIIGSANEPRTVRNPFTYAERVGMIKSSMTQDQLNRTHFCAQEDIKYNDTAWFSSITGKVVDVILPRDEKTFPAPDVTLVGFRKDKSSYYLKKFPQWKSVDYEPQGDVLNATDIREMWLDGDYNSIVSRVPASTYNFLAKMEGVSGVLRSMLKERSFLQKHREMWSSAPYPPTFNTTDAVVVQSSHVLMVKRRAEPGKGLWALPGGYLEQDLTLEENMLKELREETKIDVPDKVIVGSIKDRRSFDDPNRSPRGRIITEAFLIKLQDSVELPKVKGGDDAAKAAWVPLSELDRSVVFEDHYDIINIMLGRTPK